MYAQHPQWLEKERDRERAHTQARAIENRRDKRDSLHGRMRKRGGVAGEGGGARKREKREGEREKEKKREGGREKRRESEREKEGEHI